MVALRVGVLGPGGVGGLLAALLAREGADVVCIAPAPTAAIIAEHGLSITSHRFGSFNAKVTAVPQLQSAIDVLCVSVKATMLETACGSIPADVLDKATIVPFLNGVEHVELLRSHFTQALVVAAIIRVESTRIAPAIIVQASPFTAVELAPKPSDLERLAPFVDALSTAGIDVALRDDERTMLWDKLIFLAPLALLTTSYRVPAGVARTQHRAELESLLEELARVAQADGVSVDTGKTLERFDSVPFEMQSSMQRDADAGRAIEIDAIGGAVVRLADAAGIAVPNLHRLVEELGARDGQRR